ncbi:MAG: AAA family ATPase, partial [Myxococcota bacterium]
MFPTIPQSAVVVLAGIAGSGKSTWAQQWFRDTEILSSDQLRAMLTDDEEHRSCSGDAFKMLKTLLDLRLTYGRRVVVDATSLKREARRPYLEAAKAHHVPAMLVWFDIPEEVCRRRQHQRRRKVPVHAIRRQAELVEMLPTQILDEPWDAIGRVGWVPPSQGGPKLEFEVLRAWSPPRITRPTASSAQLMVPGLDIIGDVHGCSTELDALLAQLGWSREGQSGHWSHPEDRMVVFVGDLTDRGPDSIGVLLRAVTMVDQGQALLVRGNHDDKLLRWLQGRSVELKHGLETTVAEFEDLTHDQRKALTQTATTLIANSPLWATWHAPQGLIGDPELVIAHAAWSPDVPRWPLGRARAYCLFGPT